jgi:hypothetical protein
MPPIFLFMAAAALIAGGVELLDEARRTKARDEALRRQRDEADILQGAIDLEDLRERARQRGLDPDQVVAGYMAMRAGKVAPDDVLRALDLIPGDYR